MVKLNKSTRIDNKQVTPFLIQGENVYCFDDKRQTVIIPIEKFDIKKVINKKTIVPIPSIVEAKIENKPFVINLTMSPKPIQVKGASTYGYSVIVEQKEESSVYKLKPTGFINISGEAEYSYKKNETYTPPPVVDNSRYVGRPTLDDEYV